MIRTVLLLLVGMFFCADAQAGFWDDMKAKIEARRLATIQAGKLPPVRLTEKQMASLNKETAKRGRIVWLGAGRERDGKIYVCHVVAETNWTGRKS
jgi:hypothetical protein